MALDETGVDANFLAVAVSGGEAHLIENALDRKSVV